MCSKLCVNAFRQKNNFMNPQNIMPAQDPLAQLQDIHLPPTIGMWPLAWGWWLLLIATLLIIGTTVFFIRRKISRNAYRKLALKELHTIQKRFNAERPADYLQAISILLRRTALSGFGSQFNTSLKGDEWLQWLDEQNGKSTLRFDSDAGRALLIGPYQKHPAIDHVELHKIVESWIQQHRNQWQRKNTKQKTEQYEEAEQHV